MNVFFRRPNWLIAAIGLIPAGLLPAQMNQSVGPATYTSGQNLTFSAPYWFSTSGAVVVSSGATISLQAGGRVTLKPGFNAQPGSNFHAFLVPGTDTDGDGMSDFWEVAYGLNPNVNDAGLDPDNDGLSNLAEFKNGTPPNYADNTATPGGVYYANPQVFEYTGGPQTFIVPPGVVSVKAKVWGAGGGAGYDYGNSVPRISGGAGGYSEMEWGVVGGTTLTIIVGEGGQSRRENTSTAVFGGGGYSANMSGSGGGRSEVSAPNGARLIAGGGGGGGTNYLASSPSGQGGNGGGANQNGVAGANNLNGSALGGGGGTSSAGGLGGSPYSSSGSGSSLAGQNTPIVANAPFHGGGGGGGFFGGGAGSSFLNSDGQYGQAAGGGGGSGYAAVGLNVVGYSHNNSADPYWGRLAGEGGRNGAGGNGRVVLLLGYETAPTTPQITSASSAQFTKGVPSVFQVTATNTPTLYEISGDLPASMSLNPSTGQISGTPPQTGTFRSLVKVTNAAGSSTRDLTVNVTSPETFQFLTTTTASSYTVPGNGVYDMARLKVWGAGGGSQPPVNGAQGGVGGRGGYSQMDVALTGGEQFFSNVGTGGSPGINGTWSAGGGGSSEIRSGSNVLLLLAGGGGGAGGTVYGSAAVGGSGGSGGGANQSGVAGGSVPDGGGHFGSGGGAATPSTVGIGGNGYYAGAGNGKGNDGFATIGGTGGSAAGRFAGGTGGTGQFGGGGGGALDLSYSSYPTTTSVIGGGGGGGSGYAITGGAYSNVVGYQHNNTTDSDWANNAGSAGDASGSYLYQGYSGRVVILLGTYRPAINSGTAWNVALNTYASLPLTTVLVARSFSIQSGALPPGMTLDAHAGIISGVATQAGVFAVSISASNDAGSYQNAPITITVTTPAAPPQYPPYITGFEPYEGYVAGSLANQLGWTVQSGADTSTTYTVKGQYAARIPGNSTLGALRRSFLPSTTAPSVAFIDCYVKLTADANTTLASRVEANSSFVALRKNGSNGELMVFQPAGAGQGTWQFTGTTFPLDGASLTQNWVRLSIRQDFGDKTWDLYADGKMVIAGVGMGDPSLTSVTQFSLVGHATGATYFDQLAILFDNPLFPDDDRDGLDDNWERANGLNPTINDRDLDFDQDGLTNLFEFRYGTSANVADSDGDGFTDGMEVAMGTSPTVPAIADSNPPGIQLSEPVGATLVP